jgi:hypothetical protein
MNFGWEFDNERSSISRKKNNFERNSTFGKSSYWSLNRSNKELGGFAG